MVTGVGWVAGLLEFTVVMLVVVAWYAIGNNGTGVLMVMFNYLALPPTDC